MTPGMIELGEQQFDLNKEVAIIAGKVCSDIIIVGETNRTAISEGLKESGFAQDHIKMAANRSKAFEILNSLIEANSIVLIENDLPDLYETKISF